MPSAAWAQRALQVLSVGMLLSSACATAPRVLTVRGSAGNQVEVDLGKAAVHPGDAVFLIREVCWRSGSFDTPVVPGPTSICRLREVAHGEITRVLGGHVSLAEFPVGTKVRPEDSIALGVP